MVYQIIVLQVTGMRKPLEEECALISSYSGIADKDELHSRIVIGVFLGSDYNCFLGLRLRLLKRWSV